MYFNDGTSIILSNNGRYDLLALSNCHFLPVSFHLLTCSSFEYLYYDRSGDRPVMHRRHHTLEAPPPDLSKKITLLKHFRGYMIENLTRATPSAPSSEFGDAGNQSSSSGMDFLTKYVRTKQGVLFRFSDHSIQVRSRNAPFICFLFNSIPICFCCSSTCLIIQNSSSRKEVVVLHLSMLSALWKPDRSEIGSTRATKKS